MIIYIDIDQTICKSNPKDYSAAKPIQANIDRANALYDEGNRIVYWTARGSETNIDYRLLTEKQLLNWGVKFHSLKMDKPYFDLFIDDKVMNTEDWK